MDTSHLPRPRLVPQGVIQNPELRFRANMGGTMDIPGGDWHLGEYGESIINGGCTLYEVFAGKANNFKTTMISDTVATIMDRYTNMMSSCTWKDEEETSNKRRITGLMSRRSGFEAFQDNPMAICDHGYLVVTDKGVQSLNKWWSAIRDFAGGKVKDKTNYFESEFVDTHGKPISFLLPTLSVIDSISEAECDDIVTIRDKTEVGQKEAQMLYMRQGLGKDRIIRESQTVSSTANHFMIMACQWGEEKPEIGGNPMAGPKPKKMNTFKGNEKLRGVPDSMLYLPQHVWLLDGSKNLRDDAGGNAEFPLDFDSSTENLDLWMVPARMLRSKTGMSAFSLNLIVSQKRGFQPTLTEFYNIFRMKKRFGITGSGQYYNLDLMPELKLQRTEVRARIDENPLLRRALNITSEIAQIQDYDEKWSSKIPPLTEIRKKLESDGYDWNTLLSTRGWHTFKAFRPLNDPFLSSMDILKMFYNEYEPYWLEKDKKTIRKEFMKTT